MGRLTVGFVLKRHTCCHSQESIRVLSIESFVDRFIVVIRAFLESAQISEEAVVNHASTWEAQ